MTRRWKIRVMRRLGLRVPEGHYELSLEFPTGMVRGPEHTRPGTDKKINVKDDDRGDQIRWTR